MSSSSSSTQAAARRRLAAVASQLGANVTSAAATPAATAARLDRMYPSGQQLLYSKAAGGGGEEDDELVLEHTDLRVERIDRYRVPRLDDWLSVERYPNAYRRTKLSADDEPDTHAYERLRNAQFITDDQAIVADVARAPGALNARSFVRAGVRREVVWAPGEVRAAIVTCGGLCPGLNDIVGELVKTLHYHYGVDYIYGIRDGYRGFYEPRYQPWRRVHVSDVETIHTQGGTFLGSSRGGFDLNRILSAIQMYDVNHVYIIGGDGTHRAAHKIFEEARARKLKLCVAAVPKTIDNDIGIIDRSFGFNTAVQEAQKAIISARTEACCTPNGIGIVKLMGRESGFIAAHSTIASREVDLCLIPEIDLVLDGPNGVLAFLEATVDRRGHAVVVVAEGAGADVIEKEVTARDESGNRKLPEIGKFLRNRVTAHFKSRGVPVSIKYHDPSYMIRSVPANASDSIYCMVLAQNAVHGAMAGFSGFTSALVNNRTVYLPITLVTKTSPIHLNPKGRTWERVVSSTHQPVFRTADAGAVPKP